MWLSRGAPKRRTGDWNRWVCPIPVKPADGLVLVGVSTAKSERVICSDGIGTSLTHLSGPNLDPWWVPRTLCWHYLQAAIERVQRALGSRIVSLRDALTGRDVASKEIHWEAVNKWTPWCPLGPWSCVCEDPFGAHDSVIQRCTWRSWLRKFGDSLGGNNGPGLEYLLRLNMRSGGCWEYIH